MSTTSSTGQQATAPGAGTSSVTQPLLTLPQTGSQFVNFPSQVYNLTPNSNLVRFMRTLLGDAGVGQLRKRLNVSRLAQTMQSSNFYQLDGFYGALFNLFRNQNELLQIEGTNFDPTQDTATQDQWRQLAQADASYKNRLFKFGRAIQYGPTPLGIKLVSEAILGVPCTVSESFNYATQPGQTYAQLQSYTYAQLEQFTYAELSGMTDGTPNNQIQNQFIITPQSPITLGDTYNLQQVIDILKPANTNYVVNSVGSYGDPNIIPLTNAWADSNYWEIDAATVTNGVSSSNQRPAFSSYSGEQWYYNADVTGVLSYTANPIDTVQLAIDSQMITWADGTSTIYSASNALLPWFQAILGRYAQDGIMAANPLSGSATAITSPSPSDLYFDGVPVSEVVAAIQSDSSYQSGTSSAFWSTDPRYQDDPTYEIIEFRMTSSHVCNMISFDVAHFPHTVLIQYFDEDGNTWVDVNSQSILDSNPSILPDNDSYLYLKDHPQHTADNWYNMSMHIGPYAFQRIRIVLQRSAGSPPVIQQLSPYADADGNLQVQNLIQPYNLGLRNFKVGYSASSTDDLPTDLEGPIDSTTDILGNQVIYTLYEEPANGPLQSTPTTWRCAPQPVNNAVVNYVVDTRDSYGNAQTIDTIFIDPTHVGVHATLYYSNDNPNPNQGEYEANDTPLVPPLSVISGSVLPNAFGSLQFPTVAGSEGSIIVENSAVGFNPNQPWWFGITFQANYIPTTGIIPITDFLGTAVYYDVDIQSFVISPSVASGPDEYDADTALYDEASYSNSVAFPCPLPLNGVVALVVGYQPPTSTYVYDNWTLAFQVNGSDVVTDNYDAVMSPLELLGPNILIGGIDQNPNQPPNYLSGMVLNNFTLKTEILTSDVITEFMLDPQSFCYKGEYNSSVTESNTYNAVLRFDPSFVSTTNPTGLEGGPLYYFPSINWSPIPGDFILAQGYIALQPIQAKYLKFEMTNLAAEIYEGFLPIISTVQTFSANTASTSLSPATPGSLGSSPDGTTTLLNLNLGESLYPNSSTPNSPPTGQANTLTTSPTEVTVLTDPSTATQIAQVTPQYSYADYHQGQIAPRFTTTGVPNYIQSTVSATTKVAFFCGFNKLQFSRTNIAASQDSRIYTEFFLDTVDIASMGIWSMQNGAIISPQPNNSDLPASSVQSNTYFSEHDVQGIQFAAQQSDPVEVIADDNFTSTVLQTIDWTAEENWHVVGDVTPDEIVYENNQVTISRNTAVAPARPIYWDDNGTLVAADGTSPHGDINPPVDPVLGAIPSGNLETTQYIGYGGLQSAPFLLSQAGRAWVALRIIPVTQITNPWYLQLTDVTSGNIIWQSEVPNLATGQITEYFDFFDIGAVVQELTSTGALQLASDYTVTDSLMVSIVQEGPSQDSVIIDRLSVFDESIVWEFSNDGGNTFYQALDIRSNPNGVLTFPTPSNQLVWRVTAFRQNLVISALQLRPIYSNQLKTFVQANIDGPNVSPSDTFGYVNDDPQYQTWDLPIPRWWFLEFAQSTQLFPDGVETNQNSIFHYEIMNETIGSTFSDSPTYRLIRLGQGSELFIKPTDHGTWINGQFHRSTSDTLTAVTDIVSVGVVTPDQNNTILGGVVQGHKEINNPT